MLPSTPLSLYLHVPFCSTRCTYCAFNTYTDMEMLIPAFVDALCHEIAIIGGPRRVATIFFGGGTPGLLAPRQFERIISAIRDHFDVSNEAEITLEANPNDLDRDYLARLRAAGLNRLSIGMQSAIASELALFDRRHDHKMVVSAVEAAREAGFTNVSLDLIYSIPQQTLANWRTSLQEALALQPDHLSLYALGLEGGTPLKADVDSGHLPVPDGDLAADMYDLATSTLAAAGYDQYEISNWARPGYESRHNLQYWRNLPYAGLGPGAHGFAAGLRYSTVLGPQKYIRLLQEADGPYTFPRTPVTARAVPVDRDTEIAETLMMGLRLTQEGIQRQRFEARFGVDLVDYHRQVIDRFVDLGMLYVDEHVVRLTEEARFLSNAVIREFI